MFPDDPATTDGCIFFDFFATIFGFCLFLYGFLFCFTAPMTKNEDEQKMIKALRLKIWISKDILSVKKTNMKK